MFYRSALALSLLATVASAQLISQSPSPTGLNLGGAGFVSATHGFVVGDNHTLLETLDGGHTWSPRMQTVPGSDPFYTIAFPDSTHGYICGNNQDAYRTTDGGVTWTQMLNFQLGSASHLDFLTPTRGFAGYNGALTFTPDGGQTWPLRSGYPDCPIMFGMDFRDEQVGLVCGIRSTPDDGGIYKTVNGGVTWTLVHDGGVNDVIWIDQVTALAIDGTRLLRSDDEGQTWYIIGGVSTGFSEFTRLGASNTLVGVSLKGDIWMSPDLGFNWMQLVEGMGVLPASWAVAAFDEAHAWVVGANGLTYSTADGGLTWELLNSGCGDEVMAMDFAPGDQLGFAVTHRGFVFRTRNRGSFWDVRRLQVTGIQFGREEGLRAVDIIDQNTIFTGGMGGIFFRSDDGGDTWTSLGFPSGLPPWFEIKTIQFSDASNGIIAGFSDDNTAAYSTSDGGYSWTPIPDVQGSIAAGDAKGSLRWLITAGTRVYRSTDSGVTWAYQTLPGDVNYLNDIEFANEQTGWIAGYYGYMARTTNGGVTWTQMVQPTNETYLDIEMLSPSDVLAVGYDNNTFRYFYKRSTNGGTSWTRTELNQYSDSFNEAWASPTGRFWLAGSGGKILYSPAPPLTITLPAGIPAQVAPGIESTFAVRIAGGEEQIDSASPTLWLRRNATSAFQPFALTHVSGDDYTATIPALLCADAPRFYISARGNGGSQLTLPANAPTSTYSTLIGTRGDSELLSTDFNSGLPAGWAVSGLWHVTSQCAPPGACDAGNTAYFGQDSTCTFGTNARVSGILRSPTITLPALQTGENIVLSFCSALDTEYPDNAYGDDDQAQVWFVYSGGSAPVVWLTDHASARVQTLNVNQHAGRTGHFEWRFDSMNTYMNNFRGWHVDNIRVSGPALTCTDPTDPCPADFNRDGVADFFDYLDFVSAFSGQQTAADFNHDTIIDFFDYLDFVSAFSAGC